MPERRDHGLLEGDRTAGGRGPAMAAVAAIFRRPWPPHATSRVGTPTAGLCIAKQNSRTAAILRWRFGPPLSLRVLARPAHRLK